MKEIKTIGYKIIFSTELSHDDVEEAIDSFLREVDAKKSIAHTEEMSEEEIHKTIKKFLK